SIGLAVLGTVLITVERSRLTTSLTALGLPHAPASRLAGQIAQARGASGVNSQLLQGPRGQQVLHSVQLGFAHATEVVLYARCGHLAAVAVVVFRGRQRGRQVREGPVAAPAGTTG